MNTPTNSLVQKLWNYSIVPVAYAWPKEGSLTDSDNLPAPGVIALEIVEDLQATLEQFKLIAADLGADVVTVFLSLRSAR